MRAYFRLLGVADDVFNREQSRRQRNGTTCTKHSMVVVVIVDLASGTKLFISRQRTNILEFEPVCNQPKQTKTEKERKMISEPVMSSASIIYLHFFFFTPAPVST